MDTDSKMESIATVNFTLFILKHQCARVWDGIYLYLLVGPSLKALLAMFNPMFKHNTYLGFHEA